MVATGGGGVGGDSRKCLNCGDIHFPTEDSLAPRLVILESV